MKPLAAIARMTMLELRRGTIAIGLLVLTAIVAIALLVGPLGTGFGFDAGDGRPGFFLPDAELAARSAVSMLSILTGIAVLLTVLVCSALIGDEVESGTVLTLATRPNRRSTIVLGKYIGAALSLLMVLVIWGVIVGGVLAVKARAFVPLEVALERSIASWPELLFAAAIAIAMSTVMGPRMASVVSGGVWVLGLGAGGAVIRAPGDPHPFAVAFSHIAPASALNRFAAAAGRAHDVGAPPVPDATALALAALATACWVVLGMLLFERRHDLA